MQFLMAVTASVTPQGNRLCLSYGLHVIEISQVCYPSCLMAGQLVHTCPGCRKTSPCTVFIYVFFATGIEPGLAKEYQETLANRCVAQGKI